MDSERNLYDLVVQTINLTVNRSLALNYSKEPSFKLFRWSLLGRFTPENNFLSFHLQAVLSDEFNFSGRADDDQLENFKYPWSFFNIKPSNCELAFLTEFFFQTASRAIWNAFEIYGIREHIRINIWIKAFDKAVLFGNDKREKWGKFDFNWMAILVFQTADALERLKFRVLTFRRISAKKHFHNL